MVGFCILVEGRAARKLFDEKVLLFEGVHKSKIDWFLPILL